MSLAAALPPGHHLTVIETTPHPAQPAHPVFGPEPAAVRLFLVWRARSQPAGRRLTTMG
jgi:hypothetical protein